MTIPPLSWGSLGGPTLLCYSPSNGKPWLELVTSAAGWAYPSLYDFLVLLFEGTSDFRLGSPCCLGPSLHVGILPQPLKLTDG